MTQRTVLITAFEPSGDLLGARLAEALRDSRSGPWRCVGLGGPHMEAAGVELLERTTDHAGMLMGVTGEAQALMRRVRLVKGWLAEHTPDLHVPIDAPAANWSFCKRVRALCPQTRILHLVAPQVWAWASWRVRRLRAWSDGVLCLLPFEPAWFARHGVPATFVGHPLFENAPEPSVWSASRVDPSVQTRVAMLPVSRTQEVQRNWPDLLGTFQILRHTHPKLTVEVAASDRQRAELIQRLSPGGRLPRRIEMSVGDAGAALSRAHAAVVVSGTATLEAASRGTPMVTLFRLSKPAWNLVGRWLINTRTFTLPNLLHGYLTALDAADTTHVLGQTPKDRHLVPELVPFFGGAQPIAAALEPLMTEGPARQQQREGFERIASAFASVRFSEAVRAAVDRAVLDEDGEDSPAGVGPGPAPGASAATRPAG